MQFPCYRLCNGNQMFKQSMRPFAFEFNSVTLESILSEMTIKTQQHGCKQVTENEA